MDREGGGERERSGDHDHVERRLLLAPQAV
jgi:hypothetical protein